MADQMQRIWQNKEAAAIYRQLLNDKTLPEHKKKKPARWTNALQLAGDANEADKACQAFQVRFPSVL